MARQYQTPAGFVCESADREFQVVGAFVAEGAGVVAPSGALSVTLGEVTLAGAGTATGTGASTGSLAATLGAVTLAGSGVSAWIGLSSPVAHQLFQREGVGAGQGKADISIVGSYVGNPTAIEASWNGGAYATIVSSPSGGSFTTKLPRQSVGNGTLTVRFAGDTDVAASVANVKVGDLYAVAGQSNAAGRGTSNQSYTGTAGWGSMYRSGWAALADPVGTDGAAAGSCWPILGSSVVASGGVPVAFANVAVGGTSITTWLPGQSNYTALTTAIASTGNRVCRAVLWWQGETDAIAAMSQATYLGHLRTLAAGVRDDLGAKLIPCKLQNSNAIADGNEAPILAAIAQAWEQEDDCETGPDFSDIASDDSFHLTSSPKLAIAGARWWDAIDHLYYAASGGGTGAFPVIGSTIVRGVAS